MILRESRGLYMAGDLVALHLKPDGIARAKREPVEQQLKRLENRLLNRALKKKREFAPERLLYIPYEAKERIAAVRFEPNLIVDAGENFLVDAWQNTTEIENMKYHGIGTTNTAAAEGNTALAAELTTIYNPDNTRATGSLGEGASSNIFRTVGTNTVDGTAAVVEWGLFSQAATGGGTMWSRIVFTVINLASGDSLQTTYDLTVE